MNPPQHIAALEQANKIRLARSDIKRAVRMSSTAAGARRVIEVLQAPPAPACNTWEVMDLLLRIRQVGRYHALHMLLVAGVSESIPIGSLTPRQRTALADELGRFSRG